MARHTEDEQKAKKEQIRIRASVYLSGELKTKFVEEVLKKGISESKCLCEILRYYYSQQSSQKF